MDLPGSRSLTLELNLNSKHKDISPVVDTTRVNAILSTNRIDNPVKDFANNGDIMDSFTEPHAAVYLTQAIRLEQPATSIKLMFLGNRPPGTDIEILCTRYSEMMVQIILSLNYSQVTIISEIIMKY